MIALPEALCNPRRFALGPRRLTVKAHRPLHLPAPVLITPAPIDARNVHPTWRAGFETCHGSDICDGNNWARVQADAEAAGVISAIVLTLTMLILLCNYYFSETRHIAGLSISWKLLAVMPLLHFPMPFVLAKVSAPAQALRTTGNKVS